MSVPLLFPLPPSCPALHPSSPSHQHEALPSKTWLISVKHFPLPLMLARGQALGFFKALRDHLDRNRVCLNKAEDVTNSGNQDLQTQH